VSEAKPGWIARSRHRFSNAWQRAAETVAQAEAAPRHPPQQRIETKLERLDEISIELTSKCNLECAMCSVWKGGRDGLSRAQISDLLSEARQLGAHTFTASGAEPLMRKDTPTILQCASQLGFERISLTTNGVLIKRHAKTLADIPALSIGVSIDGPEDVHDKLRGAGTYHTAINGIKAVRKQGVPVHLCTVLMAPTLATADHIIELADQLGLTSVAYQPFQPEIAWDIADHAPWQFDSAERSRVCETLEQLLEKAKTSGIRIVTDGLFPVMPSYLFEGIRPIPQGGCAIPSRFILINERGDTYPCFFMRNQSMGNINQGVRLREIWHGPVQQSMQALGLGSKCPGCLASCSDLASYGKASKPLQT